MTGDGVDTKLSIEMINKQMKEQFKRHNKNLKEQEKIDEVHRHIDYFFEYHFIIHGDYVQAIVYNKIDEHSEKVCGKPTYE